MPVKQRDAEQGQREQDEIERNAEEKNWSEHKGLSMVVITDTTGEAQIPLRS
jgi:hypothetical protein